MPCSVRHSQMKDPEECIAYALTFSQHMLDTMTLSWAPDPLRQRRGAPVSCSGISIACFMETLGFETLLHMRQMPGSKFDDKWDVNGDETYVEED